MEHSSLYRPGMRLHGWDLPSNWEHRQWAGTSLTTFVQNQLAELDKWIITAPAHGCVMSFVASTTDFIRKTVSRETTAEQFANCLRFRSDVLRYHMQEMYLIDVDTFMALN